jgi:hypothetical protein
MIVAQNPSLMRYLFGAKHCSSILTYHLTIVFKSVIDTPHKALYALLHFHGVRCLHDMLVACSRRPSLRQPCQLEVPFRMFRLFYGVSTFEDQLAVSRKGCPSIKESDGPVPRILSNQLLRDNLASRHRNRPMYALSSNTLHI